MKDINFDFAVKKLLGIEGDYSDHKADSGGKTRYGITEATARAYGYSGSMKKLPLELAVEIYYKNYWCKMKLHYIPDSDISYECFEQYVNTGRRKTIIKQLQQALNALNKTSKTFPELDEDGILGIKTSKAITKCLSSNPKIKSRILKILNAHQAIYYLRLTIKRKKDKAFFGGWLDHRIN